MGELRRTVTSLKCSDSGPPDTSEPPSGTTAGPRATQPAVVPDPFSSSGRALSATTSGPEDHALGALSPRALAPQIFTGGVAPLAVYVVARHAGLSDAAALALSSVPPALSVVGSWVWRRRLDPIGAIALVSIVAGLVAMAALGGNELMLKIRDSVVTGLFGLVCLVSLALPVKPAIFVMGRALTSGQGPHRLAEFDGLWDEPRARRVFAVLTAAWGVGLVGEAAARAVLALTLPTGPFLAVTPVLGWTVIGGLIAFTVAYVRARRRDELASTGEAPEGDDVAAYASRRVEL